MAGKQLKLRTRFIATEGVKEYRETVPFCVNHDDVVLEIGCEWGTTARILAEHCRQVIATDVSEDCIERARQQHPDLDFRLLDGFDLKAVLELGCDFTKVYIDISGLSGYRSLLDLISLLNAYASVLQPEAIVIKSGGLKHFARHCIAWHSGMARKLGDASK